MNIEDLENRFNYHPADTDDKKRTHESIREKCLELAKFINETTADCGEKSLAVTSLEVVMFWANAAVARSDTNSNV